MKFFRALAIGVIASVLVTSPTFTQSPEPAQPQGATSIFVSANAAIEAISRTESPTQAQAIYISAAKTYRENIQLHDAFMKRMLQLKRPELAFQAANVLTALQPDNPTAWALQAFQNGQRGEMSSALQSLIRAKSLNQTDPILQQLTGELLAWYDNSPQRPVLPEPDQLALENIRKELTGTEPFNTSYAETSKAIKAIQTLEEQGLLEPDQEQADEETDEAITEPSKEVVREYYFNYSNYYPNYYPYYYPYDYYLYYGGVSFIISPRFWYPYRSHFRISHNKHGRRFRHGSKIGRGKFHSNFHKGYRSGSRGPRAKPHSPRRSPARSSRLRRRSSPRNYNRKRAGSGRSLFRSGLGSPGNIRRQPTTSGRRLRPLRTRPRTTSPGVMGRPRSDSKPVARPSGTRSGTKAGRSKGMRSSSGGSRSPARTGRSKGMRSSSGGSRSPARTGRSKGMRSSSGGSRSPARTGRSSGMRGGARGGHGGRARGGGGRGGGGRGGGGRGGGGRGGGGRGGGGRGGGGRGGGSRGGGGGRGR